MPVTGEILEINELLEDSPEMVNQDPNGEAWLERITIAEPAELADLQDAGASKANVETLDE